MGAPMAAACGDTILFMFQGLEHTAIASPDPGRLAEWYAAHLGFRINYVYDGNYFVKAPNGAMLEIIPSVGERTPQQLKDAGLRHLAVTAEDFDQAYATLRAAGVNIIGEPYEVKGNRLVFFTDLDGNYLHLIQRPQPLP